MKSGQKLWLRKTEPQNHSTIRSGEAGLLLPLAKFFFMLL
jgi:hypothetical protein